MSARHPLDRSDTSRHRCSIAAGIAAVLPRCWWWPARLLADARACVSIIHHPNIPHTYPNVQGTRRHCDVAATLEGDVVDDAAARTFEFVDGKGAWMVEGARRLFRCAAVPVSGFRGQQEGQATWPRDTEGTAAATSGARMLAASIVTT